jgi:hypothetical protein
MDFEFSIPTGWTIDQATSSYVRLVSSVNASLELREITGRADLRATAIESTDRISNPLGFAKTTELRHLQGADGESVECEIRGNRSNGDRRRILYRVIEHDGSVFEIVYESSEERFAAIKDEAERIASSVQLTVAVNERLAVADLRSVNTAEVTFLAAGTHFATIEELMAAGLLDSRFRQVADGYRFRIQTDRDKYHIDVTPSASSTGRYAYQSDQTGVIRYSDRPELAPRGMAGKPLR